MAKIGLFFGTQTGNTQTESEMIQKEFGEENTVELHDIAQVEPDDFTKYLLNIFILFLAAPPGILVNYKLFSELD